MRKFLACFFLLMVVASSTAFFHFQIVNPTTAGACGTCTTNAAALTLGLPVIGQGSNAVAVGTVQGNTTKFVSATGSFTSGNATQTDSNGNLTDSGAANNNMMLTAMCQGAVGTSSGQPYPLFPYSQATNFNCTNTTNNESPVAWTGTAKNLRVTVRVAPTTSCAVTIYKTTVAQALTCTMTTGQTSCSDTTHTVAYTAGTDTIGVRIIPGQATETCDGPRVAFQYQ